MKVLITVDEFANLDPVEHEVLLDKKSIADRLIKLRKGDVYTKFNIKTHMIIMTKNGEKKIKSFIFGLTDNNVKIKGKVNIPIHCIKQVTLEY